MNVMASLNMDALESSFKTGFCLHKSLSTSYALICKADRTSNYYEAMKMLSMHRQSREGTCVFSSSCAQRSLSLLADKDDPVSMKTAVSLLQAEAAANCKQICKYNFDVKMLPSNPDSSQKRQVPALKRKEK